MTNCDVLILNISRMLMYSEKERKAEFRSLQNGALAITDGNIVFAGEEYDMPAFSPKTYLNCNRCLVTPGLIDPHTHAIWAGSRWSEFELKLKGVDYRTIASQGGGILSTVKATRDTSEDDLVKLTVNRIKAMMKYGCTTVEVKTGYGLSVEDELKLCNVIQKVQETVNIPTVVGTLLALHAIPPEFVNRKQDYIDICVTELLPKINRHVIPRVDAFCEPGWFEISDCEQWFSAAERLNFRPVLHANEFNDIGGVKLAVDYHADSIDHLHVTNSNSIDYLARAWENNKTGPVAVLFPGVPMYLGHSDTTPWREIISRGIPIALSTDYNPGSCPTFSMEFAMQYACVGLRMPVDVVWEAATMGSSLALKLNKSVGIIRQDYKADLVFWDTEDERQVLAEIGINHVKHVMLNGKMVDLN